MCKYSNDRKHSDKSRCFIFIHQCKPFEIYLFVQRIRHILWINDRWIPNWRYFLSWRYFENTIFQAGGMFGTGNILLTGSTLRAGVITLLEYTPIWWYVYQCSRVCYIPYRALCTYHEHCSELTTFFRSDSILEQRLRQIAVSRFNLFAFIISVLFHFVPNDFVCFSSLEMHFAQIVYNNFWFRPCENVNRTQSVANVNKT